MRKKISDKTKLISVFVFLLLVSFLADLTTEERVNLGSIRRNEVGEAEEKIELELEIEGLLEDYAYSLEVLPVSPTKVAVDQYIAEAITEITHDFSEIKEKVPVKKKYVENVVEAKWNFWPIGIVDGEGNICSEEMSSEEEIIQAQVELSCGNYEKIHTFSFLLKKPELSEKERLLQALEKQIQEQMRMEGKEEFILPTQIEGKEVLWKEKREYITPQILVLELIAGGLLLMLVKKKKEEERKKKIINMELTYPEIVNQLALLIGAGMTMRQAWTQIAGLYKWKRAAGLVTEDMVYEEILRMSHKLAEGESERVVYQRFSEEIAVPCYRKLMRILMGSLEKGLQGISTRLQEESKRAFEQRILMAKKRGEEASTKMMVPLLLMMGIVMAMVMLPAILEFQI